MLQITISSPDGTSQVYSIDQREILIGRLPSNDIVIPDRSVSSTHARLLVGEEQLTLVDLNSTNGTFINDERINGPHILSPNDEVRVCEFRLEFVRTTVQAPTIASSPETNLEPDDPETGPPLLPPLLPSFEENEQTPLSVHETNDSSSSPSLAEGQFSPRMHEQTAAKQAAPLPPLFSEHEPPLMEEESAAKRSLAPERTPSATLQRIEEPLPTQAPLSPNEEPPDLFSPNTVAPPSPSQFVAPSSVAPSVSVPPEPVAAKRPSSAASSQDKPFAKAAPTTEFPQDTFSKNLAHETAAPVNAALTAALAVSQDIGQTLFAILHQRLVKNEILPSDDLETRLRVRELIGRLAPESLQSSLDFSQLCQQLEDELCGLGPLTEILADEQVQTLWIRGPKHIEVHRKGRVEALKRHFSSPLALELLIRRLLGQLPTVQEPVVEMPLADGGWLTAVHSSMTAPGPLLVFRRSKHAEPPSLQALVQQGALSEQAAEFLRLCVQGQLNILICAPSQTQASQWLSALSAEMPATSRKLLVRKEWQPFPLPKSTVGVIKKCSPVTFEQFLQPIQLEQLLFESIDSGADIETLLRASWQGLHGGIFTVLASSMDSGIEFLQKLVQETPNSVRWTRNDFSQLFDILLMVRSGKEQVAKLWQISEFITDPDEVFQTVDIFQRSEDSEVLTTVQSPHASNKKLQERGLCFDSIFLSPEPEPLIHDTADEEPTTQTDAETLF